MTARLITASADTLLTRPGVAESSPLQAWDAADEYLINTLQQRPPASLTILNDGFGTLGCQLHKLAPVWVSNSACAHDALRLNLQQNQLSPLSMHTTDALPKAKQHCCIIKTRRGLTALQQDLNNALQLASDEIYIAGMAKHIAPGSLEILRQAGELEVLPTVKKARLYRLHSLRQLPEDNRQIVPIRDTQYVGFNGVFATGRIDEGTELLLQLLPALAADKHYADLCCGTGIIGLELLRHGAGQVDFFDEYKPAINNSLYNLEKASWTDKARCFWQDGMALAASDFYDGIFCNPPFHEQNVVGEHIAWRLFRHAQQCLKPGASLYVVCNRHLNYIPKLKNLFKDVSVISQHPKFMLIKANK